MQPFGYSDIHLIQKQRDLSKQGIEKIEINVTFAARSLVM
jgi:hypothetical protein